MTEMTDIWFMQRVKREGKTGKDKDGITSPPNQSLKRVKLEPQKDVKPAVVNHYPLGVSQALC